MQAVTDPFMAGVKPQGLQKGRGGFLRSADDAPYVTDPTGEIVKSGDRKGEVKRLKYGSPSNRGREIENDSGLVKYKQRLTLLGIGMEQSLATACSHLADLPIGSPEFNTAADTIVVCADRITRSSLAADRGTHGHLLCELYDRAEELTDDHIRDGVAVGLLRSTQIETRAAWFRMLADNGLEILAVEASCVDDKWRLAGTLDRIVRTTRPLTFVKKSGELVVIAENTRLILDLKFGKLRPAHPIQCASYDQSVPYDTDTETRGEWGFELSHEHALIAHGDFGDETRPVTIELVWVDLVAGREHGGQCVVDAKSWAARDDVFSVAQIVEGVESPLGPGIAPSTLSPDDCDPHGIPRPIVEGEVDGVLAFTDPAPSTVGGESRAVNLGYSPSTLSPESSPAAGEVRANSPSAPSPATSPRKVGGGTVVSAKLAAEFDIVHAAMTADPTVNDLLPRQGMPQHALDELEVDRLNDQRRQSYENWGAGKVLPKADINNWHALIAHGDFGTPDPDRLALVDARGALCPSPDEGADWSSDEFAPLWEQLRGLFDDLDPVAKAWRSKIVTEAQRRCVAFHVQNTKTERRFWINKAVIALALAEPYEDGTNCYDASPDDILRELLAHIIGDVALMRGVEPGHALGSLGAVEAQSFAHHVDAYLSPPPAA